MKNTANLWKVVLVLAIVSTCAITYSLSSGNSNDSGTPATFSSPSNASCSDVHKGDSDVKHPHHGGDATEKCPHAKGDLGEKHAHHDSDDSKKCPHSENNFGEKHPHHGGDATEICPHSKRDFSEKDHMNLPEGHPKID